MLTENEIKKLNKLVDRNDKRLSIIFKALGDERRCRMYRFLAKKKGESLRVSDIADILKISMPLASQHLTILEISGLLSKEKKGRTTTFRINREDPFVSALVKTVL